MTLPERPHNVFTPDELRRSHLPAFRDDPQGLEDFVSRAISQDERWVLTEDSLMLLYILGGETAKKVQYILYETDEGMAVRSARFQVLKE